MTFTNRAKRRASLDVTLGWGIRFTEDRVIGPYFIRPEKWPLGKLKVLSQPVDVPSEQTVSGYLAFRVSAAEGLEPGKYHEALLNPPHSCSSA
jgi:hypothetical protein